MLVIQSIILSVGIDSLHFLKNIVQRCLNYGKTSGIKKGRIIEIKSQNSCETTLDEFGLRFWPPLYVQRYMAVQEILKHPVWNNSIKKVIDFGCSEIGMFKYLKQIPGINNVMLVDIDVETLEKNQSKVVPTNYDFLTTNERKEVLIVDIYDGSIADLDDRMLGVDAIVCIELIEHLYMDVLYAVPHTVFGFIKPKVAIFTTPNVEFNVLFPNFYTQFRHDDHKFEWNRKQFEEWAKSITTHYSDYAVQFEGIGKGPIGTENLGCCTQMAIFFRKDMTTSPVEPILETPYNLLRRVNYPHELENENSIRERTVFEKLRNFVAEAKSKNEFIVGDIMEIPLNVIMPYVSVCCSSVDELESIASKLFETKINDQGEWFLIKVLSISSLDEYISESDSYSNPNVQDYSLLDDVANYQNEDQEDLGTSVAMSFCESDICFSTPMTKNKNLNPYTTEVDSSNTVFTDSDMYKTAVEYDKYENMDMEVSSSCNGSLIIDDCSVYQDFVTGRNNSTAAEEDIMEATLTVGNGNALYNDSDKANDNLIHDNTVIENSRNLPLKSNQGLNSIPKLKSNNDFSNIVIPEEENVLDNQPTVFLNRTLLDESGFMEHLLSTPDKELKK